MKKGEKMSKRQRVKISLAHKGKVVSLSFREKTRKRMLGKKFSVETKKKMSLARIGKKHSLETRKKLSYANKKRVAEGKHHFGIGGKTKLRGVIYNSMEYKLWRTAVFERDNYTCIWCGAKGGKLQADHIKPFAFFPEFRFAIDNGRTLCVPCHRTTDTWGHRATQKYKGVESHYEDHVNRKIQGVNNRVVKRK